MNNNNNNKLIEILNFRVKEIIKEWFNSWKEKEDCFIKLMYLWISFNAFYYALWTEYEEWLKKEYLDYQKKKLLTEKDQLLFLVSILNKKDQFNPKKWKNIDLFFKFQNNRKRSDWEKWWVINLLKGKPVYYKEIENLEEFILIIYQVRCNLFHWEKLAWDENDNKLVEKTALALEEFLTDILKFWDY